MAIPILARKRTGIMMESIVIASMMLLNITAINTYIGVSFSDNFFVSTTTAERKHCLFDIFLISSMASIVSSAEVVSSNMMAIIVASFSSLLNASYRLSGSILFGTDRSAKLSYHITFDTWSTFSIFSFSAEISLSSIPSTTYSENAPVPNWSTSIS